jgi:hypothetical protein
MRNYRFTVYFIGATQEQVSASCPTDAVILACAERIRKGFHRECYQVKNDDTDEVIGLAGDKTTLTVNYNAGRNVHWPSLYD